MVTDVKLLQSAKAYHPILVTEFGMVTDVKLLQPSKTPGSILVTEFGIVTDVKPLLYKYLLLVDYQYYTL